MNIIINNLKESLEETKPKVKENLLKQTKEAYSTELNDDEIEKIVNEVVDSMKYEENLEKAITTFTKNNYKVSITNLILYLMIQTLMVKHFKHFQIINFIH